MADSPHHHHHHHDSKDEKKEKKEKRASLKNQDKVEKDHRGSSSGPTFQVAEKDTTPSKDNKEKEPKSVEKKEPSRRDSGKHLNEHPHFKDGPAPPKKDSKPAVVLEGSDDEGDGSTPSKSPASPAANERVNTHLMETIPAEVLEKVKTWKVRQAALHGGKVLLVFEFFDAKYILFLMFT